MTNMLQACTDRLRRPLNESFVLIRILHVLHFREFHISERCCVLASNVLLSAGLNEWERTADGRANQSQKRR